MKRRRFAMSEHYPETDTSPARLLDDFLDQLRVQVPYTGAMITVYDVIKHRHAAVVNRGYAPELVSYVVSDFLAPSPTFQIVAANPGEIFHWDTLAGFRHSEIAAEFLVPAGFRQGASMVLDGGPGRILGSFHLSLDESVVTPANLAALGMARRTLVPLTAAHRMRLATSLSPRELDVLALICAGMNNNEIAAELWVSRRTIATHVERILRKLGATNRVQASVRAVRLGLVASEPQPRTG